MYVSAVGVMHEISLPLVYQLGIGLVSGFIAGYIIRKLIKLLVIFLIGFIAIILYLSVEGIINIGYDKLWEVTARALRPLGHVGPLLVGSVSLLPFIGSFITGFVMGIIVG